MYWRFSSVYPKTLWKQAVDMHTNDAELLNLKADFKVQNHWMFWILKTSACFWKQSVCNVVRQDDRMICCLGPFQAVHANCTLTWSSRSLSTPVQMVPGWLKSSSRLGTVSLQSQRMLNYQDWQADRVSDAVTHDVSTLCWISINSAFSSLFGGVGAIYLCRLIM